MCTEGFKQNHICLFPGCRFRLCELLSDLIVDFVGHVLLMFLTSLVHTILPHCFKSDFEFFFFYLHNQIKALIVFDNYCNNQFLVSNPTSYQLTREFQCQDCSYQKFGRYVFVRLSYLLIEPSAHYWQDHFLGQSTSGFYTNKEQNLKKQSNNTQ